MDEVQFDKLMEILERIDEHIEDLSSNVIDVENETTRVYEKLSDLETQLGAC